MIDAHAISIVRDLKKRLDAAALRADRKEPEVDGESWLTISMALNTWFRQHVHEWCDLAAEALEHRALIARWEATSHERIELRHGPAPFHIELPEKENAGGG